jgi:hypothetical protein
MTITHVKQYEIYVQKDDGQKLFPIQYNTDEGITNITG